MTRTISLSHPGGECNAFSHRRCAGNGVARLCALAVIACLGVGAAADPLAVFASRSYDIHTDLDREQVVELGRHMDAVFAEYTRRFSSFGRNEGERQPLYLFHEQAAYVEFLASRGIAATNTAGVFVVRNDFSALCAWSEGHSRSSLLQTLQHEGFHQFAWHSIGPGLPVWVNEGLAQYFQDGILVRGKLHLGIAHANRTELVRRAVADDEAVDFDRLLNMSADTWSGTVQHDRDAAALNYAQAWSICYFLIHGDRGRYRSAFEKYLHLVADNRQAEGAFEQAFGLRSTESFERRWRQFARELEPDPLTDALQKLEFLGQGLLLLREQGRAMPRSLNELQRILQAMQYRLILTSNGVQTEFSALDDDNFQYQRPHGRPAAFVLLEPARDDWPPRLTAPGLKPEPTLVWDNDSSGELVQDLTFR